MKYNNFQAEAIRSRDELFGVSLIMLNGKSTDAVVNEEQRLKELSHGRIEITFVTALCYMLKLVCYDKVWKFCSRKWLCPDIEADEVDNPYEDISTNLQMMEDAYKRGWHQYNSHFDEILNLRDWIDKAKASSFAEHLYDYCVKMKDALYITEARDKVNSYIEEILQGTGVHVFFYIDDYSRVIGTVEGTNHRDMSYSVIISFTKENKKEFIKAVCKICTSNQFVRESLIAA